MAVDHSGLCRHRPLRVDARFALGWHCQLRPTGCPTPEGVTASDAGRVIVLPTAPRTLRGSGRGGCATGIRPWWHAPFPRGTCPVSPSRRPVRCPCCHRAAPSHGRNTVVLRPIRCDSKIRGLSVHRHTCPCSQVFPGLMWATKRFFVHMAAGAAAGAAMVVRGQARGLWRGRGLPYPADDAQGPIDVPDVRPAALYQTQWVPGALARAKMYGLYQPMPSSPAVMDALGFGDLEEDPLGRGGQDARGASAAGTDERAGCRRLVPQSQGGHVRQWAVGAVGTFCVRVWDGAGANAPKPRDSVAASPVRRSRMSSGSHPLPCPRRSPPGRTSPRHWAPAARQRTPRASGQPCPRFLDQ